MKIQSKQISRVLAAFVRANNLTVATTTSSTVVTTAITTALTTAADGSSVPLQISTTNGPGVVTTGAGNRIELCNTTSKDKILAANGEEVYGRLTEAGAVYTLSYFTLSNTGVEAAYTFPAAAAIDFEFTYRFELHQLPTDAITAITTRNVNQDAMGAGSAGSPFGEAVAVTATNTIAALTKTPVTISTMDVTVNGQMARPGSDYTLSGKTITWVPGTALFDLATTDTVYARYFTLE